MTSSEDLYVILQIGRTASVGEIKRAFRKLARRYHPDINPGDRHAEDRFKGITEAYDILSDPLKREFYDVNGFYTDGVLEQRGTGSNWGLWWLGTRDQRVPRLPRRRAGTCDGKYSCCSPGGSNDRHTHSDSWKG